MKVGTDGVLLGAWMDILPSDKKMLDIGAGTGVISLMVAQRSAVLTKIIAVEPDGPSAAEAASNFEASPWKERLSIVNDTLQNFTASRPQEADTFDLIFTNPPYFIDSLKAPDHRRSNARHTSTLTHEDILSAASHLLKCNGRLAIILPTEEAEEFIRTAETFHIGHPPVLREEFHLSRLCKVHTTENKKPKRYLMEFTTRPHSVPVQEARLYIQKGTEFTEEYKSLTSEFYLKF